MKINTHILLISLLVLPFSAAAEFEGIVTYSVKIIGKTKSAPVKKISKDFGKEHKYYYKNGCHKWTCKGSLEFEIYNPTVNPDVIVSKYHDIDTLYYNNCLDSSETVGKTTVLDKEVIADKICRGVTFQIINKNKKEVLKRTWYYPSSGLEYAEGRYTHYKLMGQDYLVNYCKSVPLLIILEWPGRPYYAVYKATKIEEIPLSDSEFQVDASAPVKHETE